MGREAEKEDEEVAGGMVSDMGEMDTVKAMIMEMDEDRGIRRAEVKGRITNATRMTFSVPDVSPPQQYPQCQSLPVLPIANNSLSSAHQSDRQAEIHSVLVHLQRNTMRSTIHSIIVQLEPIQLQTPPTSRMNNELRNIVLRTLKPLGVHSADSGLAIPIRDQNVGVVVCDDIGTIAPGGATVHEFGVQTRDVDCELAAALEAEGSVLDEVLVDVEVEAALCGVVPGDVEV
jgi:hypothetical protein